MKGIKFSWGGQTYKITTDQSPLLIAEAGVNHNGDIQLAKELIDIAKKAGADFVKFQTFHPNEIATPSGESADYIRRESPKAESWLKLLEDLTLPDKSFKKLLDYSKDKGIIFLSTPYDYSSADLLDEIGVPIFKIASTDASNIPFIEHVAKKGKPVIISTGLSSFSEVQQAVNACRKVGNNQIIVMQCTSNYPASLEAANLKVISTYRQKLNAVVGYSDHTNNDVCAALAVGQGAVIIERHFTKDKNLPGPDQSTSSNPAELKKYIEQIRTAYIALGDGVKKITPEEKFTKSKMQKSLTSTRDIKKGDKFSKSDILIRRPATGIHPSRLSFVIGKKAARNIRIDRPIKNRDVSW